MDARVGELLQTSLVSRIGNACGASQRAESGLTCMENHHEHWLSARGSPAIGTDALLTDVILGATSSVVQSA
jgi:hypothetical protein